MSGSEANSESFGLIAMVMLVAANGFSVSAEFSLV
jgi:hypothetical protein